MRKVAIPVAILALIGLDRGSSIGLWQIFPSTKLLRLFWRFQA